MKTNWRRLGSVLADILSSRERLVAAANEVRAQPEMEGDPLPTGGDIDSGSPTRATGGEARDGKERTLAETSVELPEGAFGDGRKRQQRRITLPGSQKRTRSGDGWVIRPPRGNSRGPMQTAPYGSFPAAGIGLRVLLGKHHDLSTSARAAWSLER